MVRPFWKFMLVALAGWMNRQQQDAIDYLRVENSVLREKLGQKRIRLNDSQRARLGEAAAKLGRELLAKLGTPFSPETLLRWHRWFIARKYDGSDRRGKRGPVPKKANSVRKLVVRMATDKRGAALPGINVVIWIQCVWIGRRMFTTAEWLEAFIDRLTAAKTAEQMARAGGRDGRKWREFIRLAEADIVLRQAGI